MYARFLQPWGYCTKRKEMNMWKIQMSPLSLHELEKGSANICHVYVGFTIILSGDRRKQLIFMRCPVFTECEKLPTMVQVYEKDRFTFTLSELKGGLKSSRHSYRSC
ncbi:hypothetical protein CEXT_781671 [Caerostris extrusa]|uniref:Uncharacterized protein n=1 Tax=Caerostris extrusa TaxID=172846 RepID=A0AAV4XIV5_CAEEX|nr:hypothetical protein CEXT_781671 [Caerostris extrusa]